MKWVKRAVAVIVGIALGIALHMFTRSSDARIKRVSACQIRLVKQGHSVRRAHARCWEQERNR